MKIIINGKIIKENEVAQNEAIVFDEKIIDFIPQSKLQEYIDKMDEKPEVIDAQHNYVSPGFIDIHIHGAGGRDTMDGTLEDLNVISATIAKHGVTSFLPTTMTMSKEKVHMSLDAIRKAKDIKMKGAQVLGAHMEGPFINKKYKGAQNELYVTAPSYDYIKDYTDVIKVITMAPEEDKDYSFIKKVSKEHKEITLSMGHTNTSYDVAMEAIKAGISHGTHTFNAMSPLNHRNPGAVGAIFNSNVTCEIIADTIHIHPDMYKLLLKIKGLNKVILITDCMRAGCIGEGVSELGGQKVIVDGNSARLEDGTLAGSILTLNNAVRNVLMHTELLVYEAIKLATLNPAKVIHVDKTKGSLEKGKDSDIIIFDNKFNVLTTIVNGNIVFK